MYWVPLRCLLLESDGVDDERNSGRGLSGGDEFPDDEDDVVTCSKSS
jgi:hypothetical protein